MSQNSANRSAECATLSRDTSRGSQLTIASPAAPAVTTSGRGPSSDEIEAMRKRYPENYKGKIILLCDATVPGAQPYAGSLGWIQIVPSTKEDQQRAKSLKSEENSVKKQDSQKDSQYE